MKMFACPICEKLCEIQVEYHACSIDCENCGLLYEVEFDEGEEVENEPEA